MDSAAAALGALAAIVLVLLTVAAVKLSDRERGHPADQAGQDAVPQLPEGIADVLLVLGSSGIVLDSADAVVNNSPSAVAYGLVRGRELVHPELLQLARQVRRDGVVREAELELPRGPLSGPSLVVGARVAPLRGSYVLLLVDDHTHARRLEEIRRDFVANVSHELKTPVGGLVLLAEAVLDARDDPEAVARFATRMQVEAERLTTLVKEIVDLSRLQVADTLSEPALVDMMFAAREAIDRTKLAADRGDIEVVLAAGPPDCLVWGERELLVTAITNLIGNAISYSTEGTRVTVRVSRTTGHDLARLAELVEVAVTDQGTGIPKAEQERIFERFYRVDVARSRATGGTGLGLSIVKHVCANHGGEVTVWSEPGRGSTFTMRLPAALDESRRTPTPTVTTPTPAVAPAPLELSLPAATDVPAPAPPANTEPKVTR